jgi:hypothetical protein
LWRVSLLVIALAHAGAGIAGIEAPDANGAASLRTRYGALQDRLNHSPFQMPLVLDSDQTADKLEGGLYGVVDHPFATIGTALTETTHWCDILILHLNVKGCRASAGRSRSSLAVYIGSKYDQPLEAAFRVEYVYRVVAEAADYLQIVLTADTGPLGTRNYQILFEAVPLEREHTFIHLTYSYAYGTWARMAMEVYLRTIGRAKVGFTVVDRRPDGQPIYVAGVRGVVERNAMRYYLAVVAYLDALSAPPQEQFEKRSRDWFALTERHALQLHEMAQNEYLDMKRREYRRH